MNIITSRQNAEIKAVAGLQQAKQRKKENKFLAEGIRTIETLITTYTPIKLYMTQTFFDQQAWHNRRELQHISTIVTPEVMDKMSTAQTPSGIVGVFAIPSVPATPLTKGIVLVNMNNPGNVGTLIRTAAAIGTKTVIVVDGVDPWHPKVIQATAGTIAYVNIYEYTWQQLLQHKKQLKLCALVVKDGQSPEILEQNDILLVVGNEAQGIPEAYIAACELTCTLAMPGNIESLNASIAGSIALYLAFIKK